ncbi:MAG: glycyl-radical enzyme activating protein [Actinobacteria bacterium]|nr:glycyl-radical enzyme activating protein [Actinomycetota bacterium]MBU1944862.1 glycyl-radical enzyme activating protein [Actinomycetota bacterium]MBU2688554.1 glycyl-radical enzyme activating protein [Actinomycetota bacterium]
MGDAPPAAGRTGTPLILEIKGNSLDDGPGIRTVVFFKGCPLSCAWCHNPESKKVGPELSFDPRECAGCGLCIETCPRGAIDDSIEAHVDRSRCDLCFECVETCPSGALSRVGREMSVGEVAAVVEKDLPFFRTSGGGVTLSGGEPTLFMDYCSRLLARLKEMGVHTILETCGLFDADAFVRTVLPHLDAVYFDLKLYDPAEHRRWCGTGNETVLANFAELMRAGLEGGVEVLPRIPLIPGITATDENLEALAELLRGAGAERVALLEYNPLWLEKTAKVGGRNPLAGRDASDRWMERSDVERCRAAFEAFELA